LAALLRIGWTIKRQSGTSHRILARPGWQDMLFTCHHRVTLGPTAMKVLAEKTGLTPKNCRLTKAGNRRIMLESVNYVAKNQRLGRISLPFTNGVQFPKLDVTGTLGRLTASSR
jgi:predicted RNA binding protein YcfA (HicA-like mRNA interferase family)